MKGLLVLQRRFLIMGHQLAILLKENGAVQDFCAYIQIRDGRDLLANQEEIHYSTLVLEEDILKEAFAEPIDLEFLRSLEKEIGTLWKYIEVDRTIRHGQGVREYPYDRSPFSYGELLQIVQAMARKIIQMLDEEKPDFVYMYQPGFLGAYLIYGIAKHRGIRVFLTEGPSIKNLVALSDTYKTISGADKIFRENLKKKEGEIEKYTEACEYVDTFRNKPFAYSSIAGSREKRGRFQQFSFLKLTRIFRTLHFNFYQIFLAWYGDAKKRSDYSTINPFLHLLDRTKRKLRNVVGFRDLLDKFDPSVPYAYFPLQHEPELNLLLNAPFAADQLEVAKRIARSLPVGMYLYVKEHPDMAPYRTRLFYKELKKIPNVRLIDPQISGFELEKNAQIITTISGSAGWEGALLGKPVIAFGESYYNSLPSVHYSKTPEELSSLIEHALKQGGCSRDTLVRYVAALMEDGAESDFGHLWENEPDVSKKKEGMRDLARLFSEKLQLIGKQRV